MSTKDSANCSLAFMRDGCWSMKEAAPTAFEHSFAVASMKEAALTAFKLSFSVRQLLLQWEASIGQ